MPLGYRGQPPRLAFPECNATNPARCNAADICWLRCGQRSETHSSRRRKKFELRNSRTKRGDRRELVSPAGVGVNVSVSKGNNNRRRDPVGLHGAGVSAMSGSLQEELRNRGP